MKKLLAFCFAVGLWHCCLAQNSLYVLHIQGEVRTVENTIGSSLFSSTIKPKETPVKRGGEIKSGATLSMAANSSLTCIDREGNTYRTTRVGTFNFDQLVRSKRKAEGITTKYIQRLMAELNSNYRYVPKTVVGGTDRITGGGVLISNTSTRENIVRADSLADLMYYPLDSCLVHYNTVRLKWQQHDPATNKYFVFIRQKGASEFIKIPVSGTDALDLRRHISLKPDQEWQWAVSDQEFPTLNQIRTYSFKTLSAQEFNSTLQKYRVLIAELKRLSLPEEEINQIIYLESQVCL